MYNKFCYWTKNYNESLTQGDKQEIIHYLNKKTDGLLIKINRHLEE